MLIERAAQLESMRGHVICLAMHRRLSGTRADRAQIKNVTDTSAAALQQDVEELQRDADAIQQKLQDTLDKFEDVQQEAQQIESDVVDEVHRPPMPCQPPHGSCAVTRMSGRARVSNLVCCAARSLEQSTDTTYTAFTVRLSEFL